MKHISTTLIEREAFSMSDGVMRPCIRSAWVYLKMPVRFIGKHCVYLRVIISLTIIGSEILAISTFRFSIVLTRQNAAAARLASLLTEKHG